VTQETRYVVRRADGKFLVICSMMEDLRRVATWIDDVDLATRWPSMTGATMHGLDLDPLLIAERGGWEVVPVSDAVTPYKVLQFSLALFLMLFVASPSMAASSPGHATEALGETLPASAQNRVAPNGGDSGHFQSKVDWKPYVMLIGGQTAAVVAHERFLTQGCIGTNPLYRAHPSVTAAIVPAVIVATSALAMKWASDKAPRHPAKTFTKALAYALGAVGIANAVPHVQGCGR
jgi:hypothetical protein